MNADLAQKYLPADAARATLIGRVWMPGRIPGPAVVTVRDGLVFDLTSHAPLVAELLNGPEPADFIRSVQGLRAIGTVEEILRNTLTPRRDAAVSHFISPADLQSLKACGVTFANSLLERVIEEKCGGDAARAADLRASIEVVLGGQLRGVKPGTRDAERLRDLLVEQGLWSQYLEVGIGPDAEVFTKSQPLSSVGLGAEVGIHPRSVWNNTEPEVALAINSAGRIVGCLLSNEMNLRDFESRSALLLGVAKDNNASCALGPFIRLLDADFTLEDVRGLTVTLRVEGEDGFELDSESCMAGISRDVEELVAHAMGTHHQYPDGCILMTGTMFTPTKDRAEPGGGFTHKVGDRVLISSPRLGTLENRVQHSDKAPPWSFGAVALMRNLAARAYL
jgi:fumarylacetoacetate (FAA) hydrolase family protein